MSQSPHHFEVSVPKPPRKKLPIGDWVRTSYRALLGTRVKKTVAVVAAVVVIASIVAVSAVSNYQAEQRELAAAAERAEAELAAEILADELAAEALAAAQRNAELLSGQALELASASASFAEPAVLAELSTAGAELVKVIDGDDIDELQVAMDAVRIAMGKVGTAEDAKDRAYLAAREAAGGYSGIDRVLAIRLARDYCTGLDSYYAADPRSAYVRFVTGSGEDLQALQVYCPRYQVAIDFADSLIPADGGFAVAEQRSARGVYPKVITAGTYKTVRAPVDCYYEINNQTGKILDNNFVTSAPGGITVTLRAGQGFDSSGCGDWAPQ